LGAVAWVGGSMFYMFVIRPVSDRLNGFAEVNRSLTAEFQHVIKTAVTILIITGVILAASRLTSQSVSLVYVIILGIKVSLASYMFYLAWLAKSRNFNSEIDTPVTMLGKVRRSVTSTYAVLVLGVIVFGLSDLLTLLVETNLEYK